MHKEKSLAVNEHFQLQWEEKQNSFVLLYPEGMVQLNQSAGEILNLCDGKHSFKQIVIALEKKFSVDGLSDDIEEFLKNAMERGWVKYNEQK